MDTTKWYYLFEKRTIAFDAMQKICYTHAFNIFEYCVRCFIHIRDICSV